MSDIPESVRKACADHAALPSAFAAPVADALTALAELQRISAAMGPLIPLAPRLDAVARHLVAVTERLEAVARYIEPRPLCTCPDPQPVALAAGCNCTNCGHLWMVPPK